MEIARSQCVLVLVVLAFLAEVAAFLPEDSSVTSITRQNSGDTFSTKVSECNTDVCIGLSSGTASKDEPTDGSCTCKCHQHLPAFREDLQICVDDIHECILSPFVSGSTKQQIPFVFLPLKGQIIHPSKEISFAGVEVPVCAVSGAKFLTDSGWIDLRNPLDADVPFRLFRDEGRTFLQWVGDPELRTRMGGRLVLVHFMCRDVGSTDQTTPTTVVFTRCVAFRVVGTPTKYLTNVSEVVFSTTSNADGHAEASGLTLSEYVAIGICSVLLGLIYVASVFLYLHLRRRRKESEKLLHRHESHHAAEEGVVKNNPLLNLARHFPVAENSLSDSGSSDTDATPDIIQQHDDRKNVQITAALIHPNHQYDSLLNSLAQLPSIHQETIERLPEENVSIVETLEGREERSDASQIMGTTRRKLYFNPAYFEPHLLLAPPPAAIEFLTKIREVIAIAKQKMATKKFTPILIGIPEEEANQALDVSSNHGGFAKAPTSRRNSLMSLKRENSRRRRSCSGCPGCERQELDMMDWNVSLGACETCSGSDSKQNSIRRWLENVVPDEEEERQSKKLRSPTNDSLRSGSARKPRAPPPPLPLPAVDHVYDVIADLPDMVHEAVVIDSNSDPPKVPTLTKKKMNAVISQLAGLERTRKTDYETDSLERARGHSTPTEYADVSSSSQPSPSLSTALPLDEEMTMRNAIINARTGNRTLSKLSMDDERHDYELIVLKNNFTLPEILQRNNAYNLVTEVYVNNGYNYGSAPSSPSESNCSTLERPTKLVYEPDNSGHLMIEVQDCADNYIKVEDSDSYEPDTLDRQPKMRLFTNEDYVDSLERPNSQIMLKTTGSFKKEANIVVEDEKHNGFYSFGSLREIYENNRKSQRSISTLSDSDYKGRLLTLEERHSKRQRKSPLTVQPDVIPTPIYEHPKPPRKVEKPPLPPKNSKAAKDLSILQSFINTEDMIFKNSLSNPLVLQAATITTGPSGLKQLKKKRTAKAEDSGYLSNDERISGGSETDESLGDGHSESGAESVETHSVFFGSFRKNAPSVDSGVEAVGVTLEDTPNSSSDSETMSYSTVVPFSFPE